MLTNTASPLSASFYFRAVRMTVTICSCPALCLIGDGGNLTSHGVCRHIDDRGIDGDSISRGVGGLDDNIGLMATRSAAALAASNDVFIR